MDNTVTENADALADFVDEALESLRALPTQLETYRSSPNAAEPINAVFRAIHSIKGCAAFIGLDAIRAFSHSLENSLDVIRTESTPLDDVLGRNLIEGFDRLEALLQEAACGNIVSELQPEDTGILDAVKTAVRTSSCHRTAEATLTVAIRRLADQMESSGPDARLFAQELRGFVQAYTSQTEQQAESPPPVTLQPDDYHNCQFTCGDVDVTERVAVLLQFFSDFGAGRNCVESERAFLKSLQEFAAWAENAGIAELENALRAAGNDFQIVHESPLEFDDNLISLIWEQLAPTLERLRSDARSGNGAVPTDPQSAAAKSSQPEPPEPSTKSRFVRVKKEHLDTFLEHVSRMFIISERFRDLQTRMAETRQLHEMVDELRQVNMDLKVESTELQRGVMALRRVSISGLFSKFPRMARSLASQLGKQIHVHLIGEETEIDKQLSEDLDAPLTHLVRNVVDHGIELPEQRAAACKGDTGNLHLEARSTRNKIMILVRDDGRGMDPQRLRAKAVEKGILSQDQADALSNEDALHLIFHPGFSTAEKVSEVSGRGVGMDVVRDAVEQHHGQVSVESVAGHGTTLRLEFPVRQATLVIDGLMVANGTEQFVVPFEYIQEVARVDAAQFASVHGRRVMTVRNSTYDAVHLGQLTGLGHGLRSIADTEMAVVVQAKSRSLGICVDKIVGHRQVVVTSLNEVLPDSTKLAGIAQLGGGRLAPVLNIPEIVSSLA